MGYRRMMSAAEVAELLGIHIRTVQCWAKSGRFGDACVLRVGRHWRFDPDKLDAWIKGSKR